MAASLAMAGVDRKKGEAHLSSAAVGTDYTDHSEIPRMIYQQKEKHDTYY